MMPAQQPATPDATPPNPQGAMQGEAVQKIQKILLAAKKFMYSPQTHQMFLKELAGNDPVPVKAGRAAAHVILYLFQLSKMQMNPQLVIPSGILILADIVDFIGKTEAGGPDESTQEEAVKVFMQTIMQTLKLGQPEQAAPAQAPQPAGLIGATQ